ncbi:MAG TPA: hypothetical protein VJJ46_14040 [Anaerolineales bacterium]|nr:hypothetical protein [Anaerolineales bacterium]
MRQPRPFVLALILLSLTALGCAGIPFLQPTPTPTPTSTPTATATATPTLTPTPAPTRPPVSTATLLASGNTRTLADGSIEFTDPEVGYRLVLPAEWLVLDLGAADVQQALEEAAELNLQFSPLIESSGAQALFDFSPPTLAHGIRLMAMDLDPQALAVGYPTNIVVVTPWRCEPAGSGCGDDVDYYLEATALSIEGEFQGAERISYEMIDDLNGSPAGRIDLRMPLTTSPGSSSTIRATWILLLSDDGLIELILQAEDGLYAGAKPQLEAIIQTIELIGR